MLLFWIKIDVIRWKCDIDNNFILYIFVICFLILCIFWVKELFSCCIFDLFFFDWCLSIFSFIFWFWSNCVVDILFCFILFWVLFNCCVRFLLFVLLLIRLCVNWFMLFKYVENFWVESNLDRLFCFVFRENIWFCSNCMVNWFFFICCFRCFIFIVFRFLSLVVRFESICIIFVILIFFLRWLWIELFECIEFLCNNFLFFLMFIKKSIRI